MSKILAFPGPALSAPEHGTSASAQTRELSEHLSALSHALLELSRQRYAALSKPDLFVFDDDLAVLLGHATLLHDAVQRTLNWSTATADAVVHACGQLYVRSEALLSRTREYGVNDQADR